MVNCFVPGDKFTENDSETDESWLSDKEDMVTPGVTDRGFMFLCKENVKSNGKSSGREMVSMTVRRPSRGEIRTSNS